MMSFCGGGFPLPPCDHADFPVLAGRGLKDMVNNHLHQIYLKKKELSLNCLYQHYIKKSISGLLNSLYESLQKKIIGSL